MQLNSNLLELVILYKSVVLILQIYKNLVHVQESELSITVHLIQRIQESKYYQIKILFIQNNYKLIEELQCNQENIIILCSQSKSKALYSFSNIARYQNESLQQFAIRPYNIKIRFVGSIIYMLSQLNIIRATQKVFRENSQISI
ncbi:unnamed protein product [Paramecium octaurelia]|uniref:Uncharacterized protein n=1 Tax=Paramecium octaurelia TaxID=43137 RepID=A0A8S1YJV3_PAROT|nr:unnamed protein product [Paramecium octaurelia]